MELLELDPSTQSTLIYIRGNVLRKIINHSNCQLCTDVLIQNVNDTSTSSFLFHWKFFTWAYNANDDIFPHFNIGVHTSQTVDSSLVHQSKCSQEAFAIEYKGSKSKGLFNTILQWALWLLHTANDSVHYEDLFKSLHSWNERKLCYQIKLWSKTKKSKTFSFDKRERLTFFSKFSILWINVLF